MKIDTARVMIGNQSMKYISNEARERVCRVCGQSPDPRCVISQCPERIAA